jgi:hypothetical protein
VGDVFAFIVISVLPFPKGKKALHVCVCVFQVSYGSVGRDMGARDLLLMNSEDNQASTFKLMTAIWSCESKVSRSRTNSDAFHA